MLGKSNCTRIRLVPEQSVLKPSTSMGAVPLLMSLSFVGSLLAIPAPDCPALSWHQKGMRIDCLFFLQVGSEYIQATFWKSKMQKNQTGSRTDSLETFLPLWAQDHHESHCPMLAACLKCQRQTAQPCVGAKKEHNRFRFFWNVVSNAFRRRSGTCTCNTIRLVPEQSVLKPSNLYGQRYTINLAVPCWQRSCKASARLPSPELAPRRNENTLHVFLEVG